MARFTPCPPPSTSKPSPAPLDETWRANLIASRIRSLLQTYDAVIHTDPDELLIPDPARWPNLQVWARSNPPPVVTAFGLDVQHIPSNEPTLDPTQPIASQRTWLRFSAAMCKPVWTQCSLHWCSGFHSAD